MAIASKDKADKGQIAKAYATLKTIRERVAKFGDTTPPSERANVADTLLGVLPTIREANPDDGKKVRRIIRKMGHFISRDGYDVKFANAKKTAKRSKRERKANHADTLIENVDGVVTDVEIGTNV